MRDLIATIPYGEGGLESRKALMVALVGWLVQQAQGWFWVMNQAVPMKAILTLWVLKMAMGVLTSFRYGVYDPEGNLRSKYGKPMQGWNCWDSEKWRKGCYDAVYLWFPLLSLSYICATSDKYAGPAFASLLNGQMIVAMSYGIYRNIVLRSGHAELLRGQKALDAKVGAMLGEKEKNTQ